MSTPPTLSKPAAATGSDHDALPSGTRFGEFEILRVIGVGGFGIVYLAQDHSLEREVALKEYMPASLAARGDGPQITIRSSAFAETYAIGLRSFINEARLLARFDHPSLVKVYRFWEDNATAYMVMPFLQGTTLRDTRRGMAHPPDEAWIKSVITPILSALDLLHREGVYHRDIAPDNILLPRDGPPVLLDFGAARRVISDRTQSLTAILKPSYAPIEQYAEMTQLRQGPWTDLYALGAVVHYLVFGVPPAPATARAVAEDGDAIDQRVVPGISPRFMEAMAWMLAVRPNQRPQSGDQLRAVLDGHAEIPPRGRPGMTIPGTLAPGGPQIETAADATRINAAYVPTQMTGTRSMPTSFSPTTQMPTARQTPGPRQAGAMQSLVQSSAAPTATQGASATAAQPTTQQAQRVAAGASTAAAAAAAAEGAAAARSGPPSVSPPFAGTATSRGGAPSKPAPFAPTGSDQRPSQFRDSQSPASRLPPSRPAALGAATTEAAPSAARPKPWLLIAGGAIAAVVAIAAAVQLSGGRDTAGAASPASAALGVPSTVPANQSTGPTETILEPPTSTAGPAVPATETSRSDADNALKPDAAAKLDATAKATSPTIDAGLAASAARARPPGRPVPKAEDAASSAIGSATAPRANEGTTPSPPAYQGQQTNPTRAQAQQPPQYAAPRHEETAAEFCSRTNNGFFAVNVCKDEKCEEPRYRNSGDCPAVIARKRQREH